MSSATNEDLEQECTADLRSIPSMISKIQSIPFNLVFHNPDGLWCSDLQVRERKKSDMLWMFTSGTTDGIGYCEAHLTPADVDDAEEFAKEHELAVFYAFDRDEEIAALEASDQSDFEVFAGVVIFIRLEIVQTYGIRPVVVQSYWMLALVGCACKPATEEGDDNGHFVIGVNYGNPYRDQWRIQQLGAWARWLAASSSDDLNDEAFRPWLAPVPSPEDMAQLELVSGAVSLDRSDLRAAERHWVAPPPPPPPDALEELFKVRGICLSPRSALLIGGDWNFVLKIKDRRYTEYPHRRAAAVHTNMAQAWEVLMAGFLGLRDLGEDGMGHNYMSKDAARSARNTRIVVKGEEVEEEMGMLEVRSHALTSIRPTSVSHLKPDFSSIQFLLCSKCHATHCSLRSWSQDSYSVRATEIQSSNT